jgi:hypothetical protein
MEDIKDRDEINYSGEIPACGSETICETMQDFLDKDIDIVRYEDRMIRMGLDPNDDDAKQLDDFLGEEDNSYDEYLRIKRDALRSILYEEDRIQELMFKLKEHMLIIKNCKEEIDSAFAKYISIQWQ